MGVNAFCSTVPTSKDGPGTSKGTFPWLPQRSSSWRDPVQGSGGTGAFHGGWLVEPEVVLAKPEWFKCLTHPSRGLQKSLQLCFCLIWGGPGPPPEPPPLQSQRAGTGGWTLACTSRPSHPGRGRRLDLPVLDLWEAHGKLP